MKCKEIIFSLHAVQRMFERGIHTADIKAVIESGEIIGNYLDDLPFSSYLILGWVKERPLHLVIAIDAEQQKCYVITGYIPDASNWDPDFKTKRSP
ncbi:MAG TPA: DUF4258 domain-containing protein [Desulfobaccales bacterium]|jgi:hypothetical protein